MYFSPRTFSLSHHLISGPNIVDLSQGVELQAQSLGRHMVTIPSLRAFPSELSQGVELSLGVYHRLG